MSAEGRLTDFELAGEEFLTVEGVLERVDDDYLFDPNPGGDGPVFQIRSEGVVNHWDTGREVTYPTGERRPARMVCIRRDCTALRLEYVRLDEVLPRADAADFELSDSGVVLVPASDAADDARPAIIIEKGA
jgi:hypothetical protein